MTRQQSRKSLTKEISISSYSWWITFGIRRGRLLARRLHAAVRRRASRCASPVVLKQELPPLADATSAACRARDRSGQRGPASGCRCPGTWQTADEERAPQQAG